MLNRSGSCAGHCGWSLFLIASIAVIANDASAIPVFAPKAGATFHNSPGGQQIPVPYGVLIAPIEGMSYNKGGWCKWRLVDGRGAPVKPPTAWVKCSMTGESVGQL